MLYGICPSKGVAPPWTPALDKEGCTPLEPLHLIRRVAPPWTPALDKEGCTPLNPCTW